jgi:uncharacterized protein (UPF0276 family)
MDAVEVGPWFSVERIRDYRRALPELPFYFHGGDLIMRVGWIPGAVGDIAAYVRESASPWASLHIRMWLPGMVWLMQRYGWRMPLPNSQRAMQRLAGQVTRHSRSIRVPVVLENCEPLPFPGCEFESEPRMRDGRLCDAHEPMQEMDYALLEWVLGRTHPQVVTLEYVRDPAALREQLARLRQILDVYT